MYECAGVDRRTWDRFVTEFLIAIDGDQKRDYLEEHASRSGGNKYTEKTLKAFQAWLMKNQANQGRASATVKQAVHNSVENNEYKYTKEEICDICNVGHAAFERFAPSSISERDFIIVGSSHKKLYTETVLQKFQLWLMKNQANQGKTSQVVKQATTQAVEKDLVITEVIKSGNVEAFNQLMNQYKLAFDTAQENKRLLEQTKQMEHALNYTAVIGWKKWSDLKKELAQNFEIFQHRISFKTVAAEAGLVKETDYAERIYGEDCFPTTMISESGIDKIYNCYDR